MAKETTNGVPSGPSPRRRDCGGKITLMKTREPILQTKGEQRCLKVFYDPDRRDWDEAIENGLKLYRLKKGKVTVIALPAP